MTGAREKINNLIKEKIMTWKQFAKKVKGLIKDDEPISLLKFKIGKEEYQITSQWGSGENRELVNLWARKTKDINSQQIYPFSAYQVDKLKFYK